jgi:MFS family permease
MTVTAATPRLVDEPARRRSFATVTAVLGLFMMAAAAPTPLYGYYAEHWRFSAINLTAVFAVYAVALLAALLVAGSLSDAIGRRPVILAGIALEAGAMLLFLLAGSLGWLYAARILQGVATGLVTAAVSASLLDFQPAERPGRGALVNALTPTFGLGVGALLAGGLVQYAALPTRLVYILLLAGCGLLAVAVATMSESVLDRRRFVLRVRFGVEPGVRRQFLAALPCLIATWALGGLYLSLGPSLGLLLLGSTNRLAGATATIGLTVAGGLASIAVRSWSPVRAMLVGCTALTTGAVVTIGGLAASSSAAFLIGSAIAGIGFGSAFLGAFRTLAALATPQHRGELVAAVYIVSYLAFSIPAVVAGVAATHAGLRDTAIGFGAFVAVLALSAIGLTARQNPMARRSPAA